MLNLDKFNHPFEPTQVEETLRKYWDENGFFHASRNADKTPYTIVIPPPNVTGDLHMGHMLNNTLQDLLIRWNRAAGKQACWIPGADHASIATEAKVTAQLAAQGIDKKKIGREKFMEHAWAWKDKYCNRIIERLKLLGISCDWNRFVFTMDEDYSKSVIKALVKLYKDGLVYRGHRLVNWCPASQSVISDEEVHNEERNGHLWYIKYKLVNNPDKHLIVATTRPETLLGDLALAVSHSDERYKDLVGQQVIVPICDRVIPIVADHYVEKDFGTGVVKITPAHDMNDFEVGKRHNLGLLNIMNPNASLNENVPTSYQGLDRFVARKKLVAELESMQLLEKIEPYKLTIGISERGGVPIEYYLSEQWYINMTQLAELALGATRSKKLTLYPPHMEKIWEHWLGNIKDWCISRQLWWGHRLPMYYCQSCKHIMCEENAPTVCEKCNSNNLKQDEDVLDTWASSWLWPFAVHNWANPNSEQKKDLEYFYPTDIIITGPDIIFFWIARMVMAGEYFLQKTPFKDVYFTPIVRDNIGRKMSKQLGNGVDPKEIIDTYGTDAMRFSLVNQLVMGQDIDWDNDSCLIGKHFTNKIWNCSRFILMNCQKFEIDPSSISFDTYNFKHIDPLHNWIISEFYAAVAKCHTAIETFNFAQYSSTVYEFIWMIYCDWFIELIKPQFSDEHNKAVAQSTLQTALAIFEGMLRLAHPLIPYVTEEVWMHMADNRNGKSVGLQQLPMPNSALADEKSIVYMREVQAVVNAVRGVRGQFAIHPGTELSVVLNDKQEKFGNLIPMLEFLAKSKFSFSNLKPKFSSACLINGKELYVDLTGHVDPEKEKDRITKKIEKLNQTLKTVNARLSNDAFVSGAPEHILAGARSQKQNAEQELKLLQNCLAAIGGNT